MNVLIVEDEINNVEMLEHLLATYCEEVNVIGAAADIQSAIDSIETKHPDLVLLDVELEDGTGFDVLKGLGTYIPKVIFITGYEHYAIEAIKVSALDYILKPVNIDELKTAIDKAKSIEVESQAIAQLQIKVKELEPSYIWLSDNKKAQKVDAADIEYIKADTVYSEVHLDSGNIKFTSFHLGQFEEILSTDRFYRVHKSYIINLDKVQELEAGRGGHILMESGSKLPVAYRRKTMLKQLLNQK